MPRAPPHLPRARRKRLAAFASRPRRRTIPPPPPRTLRPGWPKTPPPPQPAAPKVRFSGRWVFTRDYYARDGDLYAPEYIEVALLERGRELRGDYRARYAIGDKPLSPAPN